ncbi:MAG TPA: 30S ribosomal protein S12 methylthiotransferase RimO [Gemmataceae bacterium]|nr:30S ribosomal protein S12 methylthiotransferase RimO [Gemmataceae bacterium]
MQPARTGAGKTYAFVSLGCPKNLVDSERMLGRLAQAGYALTPDADGADVVVVNTCGFIEPARQESRAVIDEMLELKKQGRVGAVVVAGCLAERRKDELLNELPDVDHLVGVFGREEITDVVERALARSKYARHADAAEQRSLFRPAPVRAFEDNARLRVTPRHYAYLKISEGCDRLCTFCAIPGMRGKHVTKPIEQVLDEARELIDDGVRELILVAQDSTYYGLDRYGRPRLADLLRELNCLDGLDWVRVLYAYPMYFSDELIDMLAGAEKVLPYLDLPLQHVNDRMLRLMARRVNRRETERLIAKLRGAIPSLVLRTTFIVGFPGETEAEFDELLEFVRDAAFERVGVFPYSYEPDTPATRLDGHLPDELKEERRNRLMQAQQEVAFRWSQRQVGRELDVLVDGPDPDLPNYVLGRSYADAPDIDGVVRLKAKALRAGDMIRAKVTGADGYDLAARALKQEGAVR